MDCDESKHILCDCWILYANSYSTTKLISTLTVYLYLQGFVDFDLNSLMESPSNFI